MHPNYAAFSEFMSLLHSVAQISRCKYAVAEGMQPLPADVASAVRVP